VFGDGQQRRCFCSVFDVIEGLARLPSAPESIGKVINLGSQEEISMLGLAEKVIALTGSSSKAHLVPYDQAYGPGFDDMRRRVPDLSRAKSILGWAPTRALDEIVKSIVADQRGRR